MDTLQYKDIFISESLEHLDVLNQMLLILEKNPADTKSLNEIFRTAHTLKGMAATMGFDQITELTHEMENIFERFRGTGLPAESGAVDVLFQCLDMLSSLVDEISSSETKNLDITPLMEKLTKLQKGGLVSAAAAPASSPARIALPETEVSLEHLEEIIANSRNEGFTTFGIKVRVTPDCSFKGVRAFMAFKAMSEFGEVIATEPEAQALQDGQFDFDFALVLLSKKEPEILRKALRGIAELEAFEIIPLGPQDVEPFCGTALSLSRRVQADPAPGQETAKGSKSETVQSRSVQSIRVSIERLDNLQNLVGELVINKIRLSQISKQYNLRDLKEALAHFDRVTNELQDEVTEVRMVPMEHIFNRFPRMVRDLAKENGKELDLVMEGKDIELDRTVLDEINDPLVHLLRNAVDHGVEKPEQRLANGKGRRGIIRLAASREKNHVIIKVEDDGKGIDPDVIRRVAVEHGVISQDEAARLTDQEAINLISLPGVTTATVVTEISGRGVGVDAVRTKIESFGGNLRIESHVGKGSTFVLRLPMTLAIIQALLIRVGSEIYSIPVINTVETLELAAAEVKFIQRKEVVLYRNNVLPLVRLKQVLSVPDPEVPEAVENANPSVLVTEVGEIRVGLLVDEVLGQQEIAIKSLGLMLKGVKGFSGVTILGDGRIALVLDVPTLLQ
ncbi:MAG: chemotaxis protein CheA [Candidatus Firestonebacteria bacterium]|nr:chemotaxis protein CheA [Candidatus Firestonebacteria bacterium]